MEWTVLAFDYESVIERWEDARFACALEEAWLIAGRPADVAAYVSPSTDEYAFRFWLNDPATRLLSGPGKSWRTRVIGRAAAPPEHARPLLPAV